MSGGGGCLSGGVAVGGVCLSGGVAVGGVCLSGGMAGGRCECECMYSRTCV